MSSTILHYVELTIYNRGVTRTAFHPAIRADLLQQKGAMRLHLMLGKSPSRVAGCGCGDVRKAVGSWFAAVKHTRTGQANAAITESDFWEVDSAGR